MRISRQRLCGWGWDRWSLVFLLLLAWALRLPPVVDNRFHPDEALYGYWGLLIGRGRDPWLATVPVDKPPVLPYLVAGAQVLFGGSGLTSEFAVRLPGLASGLLTLPLVAALARALYRDRWTATAATIGVALSPFAILFSATAFTDPVMVVLGMGSCVAAARGRPRWAGLLAGLSCATKQTGLTWLPLVVVVQILNSELRVRNCEFRILNSVRFLSFAVGLLGVAGSVFIWDAARVAQGAGSFWYRGVASFGGLRLIWPQELWTRLRGWAGLAHYLFVSAAVNTALLMGLPLLVWRSIARHRNMRASLLDLCLVFFLLIYLLLHWLWAFPVWDRYLLPLVPILALLLARILPLFASYLQSIFRSSGLVLRPLASVHRHFSQFIVYCSLFIFLISPAWNAAHSRYPVGGDHGAYDGIDQVAAFLRRLPEGAVVYQHWLGWHYGHYLYDAPVYLAYWPTPAWLAEDVLAFGAREPRYMVFPPWESSARVEQALASVHYRLEPVLTVARRDGAPSFIIYRILPRSHDGPSER